MSASTAIEWTERTWNPVTGCTQVSPSCDNCYAMRFSERFRGVPGHHFETGFDLPLRPAMLAMPSRWKSPRRIFVNSISDLFHRDVPDGYIDQVFDEIELVDRHVYQLLTKRPERLRRYARRRFRHRPNPMQIWLGVSVESNEYGWRADMLRDVDAPFRFLSVEPMLGPIDRVDLSGISSVIVGGESGPDYRPMQDWWVADVRDRCVTGGIAFSSSSGTRLARAVCSTVEPGTSIRSSVPKSVADIARGDLLEGGAQRKSDGKGSVRSHLLVSSEWVADMGESRVA